MDPSLPLSPFPCRFQVAQMFRTRARMLLMGLRGTENRGGPLSWFLQRGPPSTPKPPPICPGWSARFCSPGTDCLSMSPHCLTSEQHSCTQAEDSQTVLAILHHTVSYMDCIVLIVVSTNVMRKLLIWEDFSIVLGKTNINVIWREMANKKLSC